MALEENFVDSQELGLVEFFHLEEELEERCKRCILKYTVECADAPCDVRQRTDGKNGFFNLRSYRDTMEEYLRQKSMKRK